MPHSTFERTVLFVAPLHFPFAEQLIAALQRRSWIVIRAETLALAAQSASYHTCLVLLSPESQGDPYVQAAIQGAIHSHAGQLIPVCTAPMEIPPGQWVTKPLVFKHSIDALAEIISSAIRTTGPLMHAPIPPAPEFELNLPCRSIAVAAITVALVVLVAGGVLAVHLIPGQNATGQVTTALATATPSPTPTIAPTPLPPDSISLRNGQFSPFIQVIAVGQTITWYNFDSSTQAVKTTAKPGPVKGDTSGLQNVTTAYLNRQSVDLTIAAGATASFTFKTPGLYDLYDPNVATWNGDLDRVAANPASPAFPAAMENIVWVQGPVAGLPANAANGILADNDDFLFDFVAIRKGGTISFQNFDTDKHFISLVTGWGTSAAQSQGNPPAGVVNPAALQTPVITINGTADAPPHGQKISFSLTVPGLYYYFCPAHAAIDPVSFRVIANGGTNKTSVFPVPMEGFILVGN